MTRRVAALLPVALTLSALAPALALAQSSPLSPTLPAISTPATPTSTATVPVTTTSSSGGSVSGEDAIVIALGAILLLAGISFFIWRDARRRAPSRGGRAMTAADGPTVRGTKPRPKPRKPSPAERRRRKRGRAR